MKAIKLIVVLAGLGVVLLLLAANFSTVDSRFECRGANTSSGTEQSATIFLKLQTYRWWVDLWSDSHGSAWVELPNQTTRYFGHVKKAGEMLQFRDSSGNFGGNFSELSGAIGVDLAASGVFEGTCSSIRR